MCLERHATSKIRHAEDLATVRSLGFRGEALPSIAAVSRFELVTRPQDAEVGTRLRVEGGTLTDVRRVGAPVGTEVDVRSLFFNVPARRKFLRTPATELSHCTETVVRVALMRPDVDVRLRHGDRVLIQAPVSDLARRAVDCLGPDAKGLFDVDLDRHGVQVRGLASPPGKGRSHASGALYLYVNGRWVRDIVLRRAIYQAYRDLMPKGRYPVVVLDVSVPPGEVDVNVHPTKAEVRFVNPRDVTALVAEGLRARILEASGQRETRHRPDRGGYVVEKATLPLGRPAASAPLFGGPPPSVPAHPDDDPRVAPPQPTPWTPPPPPEAPPAPPPIVADDPGPGPTTADVQRGDRLRTKRLVGVARRRWVLLEDAEGLLVVDGARAALALALRQGTEGARLLVPARVGMEVAQVEALLGADGLLSGLGLEVARFGPQEVAVKAVPLALVDADPADVLRVAAKAVRRGDDPVARWVEDLEPPPLDDDDHEVRTLLATVDEQGIAVACTRLGWSALP
jgi:DNA mismatch repair protein MutL